MFRRRSRVVTDAGDPDFYQELPLMSQENITSQVGSPRLSSTMPISTRHETPLIELATAEPRVDPTRLDPAAALEFLYEGNRRFAAGSSLEPNRNLSRLREIADVQTPFAAFLGCADSRVPVEIIFDQGFGDLFVTRIAGNVATSENIGSLEFGTQVLGAKVLFVLGHTNCGAVAATTKREPVPGQISSLF